MVNAQFEVDRLRQTLVFKGLTDEEAREISGLALQDINVAINGLVEAAVNQAAEAGLSIGADEFVKEIKIVDTGGSFKIGTTSGKTDFTLPPFPMLPKLLKNAKVAKDGSLYKVIPIGKKGDGGPRKRLTTLFDVQQNINSQQATEVEQRKQVLKEARSLTLTSGAGTFSGLEAAKQLVAKRQQQEKLQETQTAGDVQFRTASSKQNASTSWVLPEKKMNMTFILDEINRRLEDEIQYTVLGIVRQYEELV